VVFISQPIKAPSSSVADPIKLFCLCFPIFAVKLEYLLEKYKYA